MPSDREELQRWLIDFRRDIHKHPELSYQEVRTTAKVKEAMEALGLEVKTFDDITGCTVLIPGKGDGPVLGLRADMDALPMTELTDVDYKSINDGVMHSCGHDAHTTILAGTAKYVVESGLMDNIDGSLKLFFQPAEEGGAGAEKMIQRGALDNPNVDAVIGCHVMPTGKTGTAGVHLKEGMASADAFKIHIQGAGGHGSRPHETRDPVVAAAHIIVAAQTIVSRNLDPNEVGVITFGAIQSGTAGNIIPAEATLTGTIRTFTHEIRDLLMGRLEEMADNIGRAFNVECTFENPVCYPPLINDEKMSAFVRETLEDFLGQENVEVLKPITGAEDFSYFASARPAAFFFLGSGNPEKGIVNPPHSPKYNIDEDCLLVGVDVYAQLIKKYFDK